MRKLSVALPGLLVVALVVLSIPSARLDRIELNELKAIRTLRAIYRAELALKAQKLIDQDDDGEGEYGLLSEISGEFPLRDSLKQIHPISPLLEGLRTGGRKGQGVALRDGYYYCLYLPYPSVRFPAGNEKKLGGEEGFPGETLSAKTQLEEKTINLQEKYFCAYAWPEKLGRTGRRTFFINEQGIILTIKERPRKKPSELRSAQDSPIQTHLYGGLRRVPSANSAYLTNPFTSGIADSEEGKDSNLWVRLR